ncbi:MAG: extracellular solute-binding protein, partial [Abditibacteriaceae bacterium]
MKKLAFALIACLVGGLLTGCASHSVGKNTLVIVSPDGRDIETEFGNAFMKVHPGTTVQWLDQNGSSTLLRFVEAQFDRQSNKSVGIGVDVVMGGGPETFLELKDKDLLAPLPETYDIPATLNGVPLRGKDNSWVAGNLSGFGILYNKSIIAREHLPTPKTWADLGNPAYHNQISLADPRQSGSAHTAYEIILQTNGWDKGWHILTAMAYNARSFISSSSMLLQNVTNGEAVAVPAIDFYARATIEQAGAKNLGYVEPVGQRVVSADPIGILRGATHEKLAQEFIKFVLSPQGQKLWMLRKGTPNGPVQTTLFRSPALPSMYSPMPKDSVIESNPYDSKNTISYDSDKASARRRVLDDLIGATIIDNHDALRNANAATLQNYVPASEAQVKQLAKEWDDPVKRQ